MGRPRRSSNIDWYSVFLDAFSHDGAVRASSDPGVQVDGGGYFGLTRPAAAAKDAVDLGPDVPSASEGLGQDVPSAHASKSLGPDVPSAHASKSLGLPSASKGLGPDVPSASKGVYDFSPVDEDKQGENVSSKDSSKLPPEFSGEKKNNGKLPLNKKKSQGHGGKKKPSVNKGRAHAIDPEESEYESSLPSRSSKRTKQQLHNSSSAYSGKVQDVVLLDDKDMEPKEEVNHEMFDRLNEQKIYYPSRDDQEAVELTRSDMKCLDPEVFLSSPVINFYIQYIKRTRLRNENFREKFYMFNTYFYGKLEEALHQPHDFTKLRRWWKSVNIFNNAYIILPIHGREHWSLVIICLPPKQRVSEPIILHLDSLGMHRSAKILKTVGGFLEKEWCFLSVAEAAWPCLLCDIRKQTVQVPQQNNAYDCGIFMLYYIEQFIKEAPARFTTDKLGMFNSNWFKPEEASGLRQRIRELLLEEFERVRLDDAIPEADASEGYDGIKDGKLEADDSSIMVIEVGVGLGNIVESNGGMKVAASEEEASGESGDVVKSTGGIIKVAASQEASEEFLGAPKSIEGLKVAASEEASGEPGDAVRSTGGIKVAASQEASEESLGAGMNIVGMKVAESEEASEESGDAVESTGGIKVAELQEASEESQNAGKSTEGINVAKSEEASEVSSDAAKSVEGTSVVESDDEASEEFGDTGKTSKGIKVLASEEASTEDSGYPAKSMEDISDVAVLNKRPTSSSNKCNDALRVLAEAAAWSESVNGNENDRKGTVKKADPDSSSKAEKKGEAAERLKLRKRIGSTPAVPDVVSDNWGAKRSEGNEEAIGSSSTPVAPPDAAVCEVSGTKVWITRVYKPTIAWPPGNWSRSSGGSSRDARRKFIEQFSSKK